VTIRKVLSEHYRIISRKGSNDTTMLDDLEYGSDMYRWAFTFAAQDIVAHAHHMDRSVIIIQRVTVLEAKNPIKGSFDIFFSPDTLKITAEIAITQPHFAQDPLSRYNSVNGWCIPETIEE
jgi:hypothetical protein